MFIGCPQGPPGADGLLGAAGERGHKVNYSTYKNHVIWVFYYEISACVTFIYVQLLNWHCNLQGLPGSPGDAGPTVQDGQQVGLV